MKKAVGRIIIILMAVCALGMLAFGPRPAYTVPPGRVRIQYWDKWTGLEADQAREVVDAFNATVGKEKGIWVDFVSMSQIDRKMLVSTAAGVPPDIAGLWDVSVLQFASMGALEPLDQQAAAYGLTRDHYKHVYYDGCQYNGKLYAIPSTVYTTALIWNKEVFQERAKQIRAAGLDPDRAPRTIGELDRYAAAIDTWAPYNGGTHLVRAGYIPQMPDMDNANKLIGYWFGCPIVDPTGTKLLLDSPQMHATYDWIRSYTTRLGRTELANFRSGFSSGTTGMFDTPQNPFLVGWNAMEPEGPWVSAFIEKLKPSMNRWHVPADQLQREKDFDRIYIGQSEDEVSSILGAGDSPDHGTTDKPPTPDGAEVLHWLAGIKDIYVTFRGGKVIDKVAELLPAETRKKYCQWGAAPFPSAVPGLENVTWAGMDVWTIPSTSKHKKEAMEFIAFASRQDQMERLCSEHCNISPLAQESEHYRQNHPNPYVDVFAMLAASPNARPLPRVLNWPHIADEVEQMAQRSYLMDGTTDQIIATAQRRGQVELNKVLDVPEDTNLNTGQESP